MIIKSIKPVSTRRGIYVDNMGDFERAVCTKAKPICIYPRSLPSDFKSAAEVIRRHKTHSLNQMTSLNFQSVSKLAKELPALANAASGRKEKTLYRQAGLQIEFILKDFRAWKRARPDSKPTMRIYPAGCRIAHNFHTDPMNENYTRRLCSYNEGSEGLSAKYVNRTKDNAVILSKFLNIRKEVVIEKINPGDMTKHNLHWIHRAPISASLRLLLID